MDRGPNAKRSEQGEDNCRGSHEGRLLIKNILIKGTGSERVRGTHKVCLRGHGRSQWPQRGLRYLLPVRNVLADEGVECFERLGRGEGAQEVDCLHSTHKFHRKHILNIL